MKVLSNKKGSALLWCVLLIIILTILLSSVLTAVYTYYNYTMKTVKRQQAYFTARSAVSVILEELTSEEQVRVNGQYQESSISILPSDNGEAHAVTISDFGFSGKQMGEAEAKLVRNEDDEVEVEITSYYPDREKGEKYVMKASVVRQPLYFGGIAVKHLTLGAGKTLTLGENTDLYWNNTDTFNTSGNGTSLVNNGGTGKIVINGNLVTKKDAVITANNVVAGRKFYGTATFAGDSLHSKKIWSPTEYIISNKTLTVGDDENVTYESSIINTLSNITDYTLKYCNSNGAQAFGHVQIGNFGSAIDNFIGQIPLINNIVADIDNDRFTISNSENNALNIQYIKVLSASRDITNAINDFASTRQWWDILGVAQAGANIGAQIITPVVNRYGRTCLDATYIDFSSTDENNRSDEVVPLAYITLDGGSTIGTKMRIRYGAQPRSRTFTGQIFDNISNNVGSFINTIFDIHNKPSYIVTYLEENCRLELGYDDDTGAAGNAARAARNDDKASLVFLYSVYGGDNTTVVLHDGVIVVGEIICDNLIIEGDAKVIYSSVSGGQVAKQKIAEYWAVSNFSD